MVRSIAQSAGVKMPSFLVTYYGAGYGHHGREQMLHAAREYYAFIALVGGLYVASGGIPADVRGQGRPWSNTLILAIGAVSANVVGTTGASVLLIRPFIRLNRGRLRPMHVLFFIFNQQQEQCERNHENQRDLRVAYGIELRREHGGECESA